MLVYETVNKNSSSYRRGLVLGLTMAEVVLLIVFALLLALAAVWRTEHQARLDVEKALADLQIAGSLAKASPADLAQLEKAEQLLQSPERTQLVAVLDGLNSGQSLVVVREAEAAVISEMTNQMRAFDLPEIDRHWKELVAAASVKNLTAKLRIAEAINEAVPGETDNQKLAAWIVTGQRTQKDGEHNWPPIINLHEAEGYTFAKNMAELTPSFEQKLRTKTIPQLIDLTQRFQVDVIEVIGHTDEQAIAPRPSNLDRVLLSALKGTGSVANLVHADNAGLGLSRAVSVVRALMQDDRLAQTKFRILPLSGGQLIASDETVTSGGGGDDPSRRRIEIRLRRSEESLGRMQ